MYVGPGNSAISNFAEIEAAPVALREQLGYVGLPRHSMSSDTLPKWPTSSTT